MVVIINADEAALHQVPAQSAVVMVFLREHLSPRDMKRLAPIVASKIAIGGTGFVARSMEEVMERL